MTLDARIRFTGDASSVKRAGAQAERSVRGVETASARGARQIDSLGASAEKQKKRIVGLGTGAALAFGAAGLAGGIKSSIDAFKDAQVQMARVSASLHTLGIDNAATRKHIEEVTLAQQRLSGFQDDELQRSFATLLRSTKDVNEALRINAIVADFARGSGKDLNVVATAFAKLTDGNTNALARYGIKAEKGATVTEVLAKAQKRYAGQAAAYGKTVSGQADIAASEFNNLQEVIGSKFAPALNAASGGVLRFSGTVQGLSNAVGGLGPIVAGAGGIGAFRLAVPLIGNASDALKSFGARAAESGGGMRGLGAAIKGSISPMAVATVGVGLLAGGVYALWSRAESADQAVQGLNTTLLGLKAASDQREQAKNQVNSAKDYVKATTDQVTAARGHAVAIHGEVAALQADVRALEARNAPAAKVEAAQARVTAKTKEWHKAMDDVLPAVHAQQTAVSSLKSAHENEANAADAVTVANDKVARKADDVRGKIAQQAAQAQRLAGNWREVGKNTKAGGDAAATASEVAQRKTAIWASSFDRASAATRRTNATLSRTGANLATVARSLGRIPTNKEIRITGNLTAAGKSVDYIVRRLQAIQSKSVTVRFNATFGNVPNAITGLSAQAQAAVNRAKRNPSAGGAWVAGRYGDGDRVPAMVAGEEAILNPKQIALVDGGMSVRGALAATGAPTIGSGPASFAKGKAPRGSAVDGEYANHDLKRKGGHWYIRGTSGDIPITDLHPTAVKALAEASIGHGISRAMANEIEGWWSDHYRSGKIYPSGFKKGKVPDRGKRLSSTATPAKVLSPLERAHREIEKRKTFFNLALAQADQDVVNAQGTATIDDDLAALNYDKTQRKAYRDWLGKLLKNPSKTTGVPGVRLPVKDRTDLIGEQTAQTAAMNDDDRAIYDLLHPDVVDAGTDTTSGGTDTGTPAGPDIDQQAIIDQQAARLASLTRDLATSGAALSALSGPGDIGSGYGRAIDAGRGGPTPAMLITMGDRRSLAALANGVVGGMQSQPSVTSSRLAVMN